MELWLEIKLLEKHWEGNDHIIKLCGNVIHRSPAAAAGIPVSLRCDVDLEEVLAALGDAELRPFESHTGDEGRAVVNSATVAVAVVVK